MSSVEELLCRAGDGDRRAANQLFSCHRDRLRRMIAVRMDPRMASRVDPSDVVQEALTQAAGRLPDYLRRRPAPFYLWLRQLALQRLIDLCRRHIHSRARSVDREASPLGALPDESAMQLASRLMASGTSPSGAIRKEELKARVREALSQLPPEDREVLVLRYLEQLSSDEIAAVLGIAQRTLRWRHRRALQRLGKLLADPSE